jgi:hypothetical protein
MFYIKFDRSFLKILALRVFHRTLGFSKEEIRRNLRKKLNLFSPVVIVIKLRKTR